MKLAVSAALLAGFSVYLVNGQDLIRAGIAAWVWLAFGWYGGKVIFADTEPSTISVDGPSAPR